MGRPRDVTRRTGTGPSILVALVALVAAGCSVFGGRPNSDAAPPASAPVERDEVTDETDGSTEPEAPSLSPGVSFDERLLAGDYEGMLAIYAADSTLHSDEHATYAAALAAARSGHSAHDPARAAQLFDRVLEHHPDTSRRFEIEVYLDLLTRERDLRASVRRLDRELQQLKAIDLGQVPADEP